jgi:hypothetical protein
MIADALIESFSNPLKGISWIAGGSLPFRMELDFGVISQLPTNQTQLRRHQHW